MKQRGRDSGGGRLTQRGEEDLQERRQDVGEQARRPHTSVHKIQEADGRGGWRRRKEAAAADDRQEEEKTCKEDDEGEKPSEETTDRCGARNKNMTR